jgi:hypothetical protein
MIILGLLLCLFTLALALKRLDDMIAQDRAVYRRLGRPLRWVRP